MDDPRYISEKDDMRRSILSEDGTLKYDFMTSLQKIAMARIASCLWMNQNVQLEIVNIYKHHKNRIPNMVNEVKDYIFAKVSQLLLPNSICEELKYLVPVLGSLIHEWIKYYNERILIPEKSEYSAVDFISNITWTARGKIDYLQTAQNILANPDSCLSDNHKYRLACTHCLEDEIVLLSSDLVNKFYLSCIEIDKHPIVYYWTAHIVGDMTEFNNPSYYNDPPDSAASTNEKIIRLLLDTGETMNALQIRIMWNKLNGEEKAKITELLFMSVYNSDFIISILSNLDYDQQKNVLEKWPIAVLCAILNDWWWWGKYFLPTALNVLCFMTPSSLWSVLFEINNKKGWCAQKEIYNHFKYLLKWLWQECASQLIEFKFLDNHWMLEQFLIDALNWEQDMDVIEVIFKDLNAQQKKNIAIGDCCIKKCAAFIQHDEWDLLDLFCNCTLFSEEGVNQLKQKLIQDKGREISISFLEGREFHKMLRFMNWAFESEEEINNFCSTLGYIVLYT